MDGDDTLTTRALTHHVDAFEDRNLSLHFFLGLLSLCEQLDPVIAACRAEGRMGGAHAPADAEAGAEAEAEATREDETLFALLGIAALSRALSGLAEELRSAEGEEVTPATEDLAWGRAELR